MTVKNVLALFAIGAVVFGCEKRRVPPPENPSISIQVDVIDGTPAFGRFTGSVVTDMFHGPLVKNGVLTGYQVGYQSLGLADVSIVKDEAGAWVLATKSACKGSIDADVLFQTGEERVRFRVLPGEGRINLIDRSSSGAVQELPPPKSSLP
jgi:hypothetical protein